MHRRYDAFIKARPDAIYLSEVPPLWQFNLSNIVFPAGALAAVLIVCVALEDPKRLQRFGDGEKSTGKDVLFA